MADPRLDRVGRDFTWFLLPMVGSTDIYRWLLASSLAKCSARLRMFAHRRLAVQLPPLAGERAIVNSIEQTIGRLLAQWVGVVQRNAVSVTVGMLLATLVIIYYVVGHLGIRGDTESLFSQDLPFKQVERRYQEAFPTLYENMFVVVDAPTPERAGEAASALAARIEAEPRLLYLRGFTPSAMAMPHHRVPVRN